MPEIAGYEWPLVGRAAELTFVEESLASDGPGVVLAGDAGVGKSRLAREALAGAEASRRHVERIRATHSARSTPLAPFAHLARDLGGAEDRLDLLVRVTQTLRERAGAALPVVGVDDAHLLDDLSATLVRHLVDDRAASVVVTVRTGEPVPDAVVSLWKDGDVPRLEVQALARHEVTELVEQALGGPAAPGTLDRLWQTSEGNALLLREIVLDALESAALVEVDGLWTWSGEVVAHGRLKEIVDDRLGALSADDRRLLELLVVGEPIGVDTLEELVPGASVADAERRGHVRVETSDRRVEGRLAHPLHGEVLSAHLPLTTRRQLCGMLADSISRHGSRRADDTDRLALWHIAGFAPSPGAVALAESAIRAATISDSETAERLARASIDENTTSQGYFALGLALIEKARWDEADQALVRASSLATTDEEVARVAVERLQSVHYESGRGDEIMRSLEATESAIKDETWRQFVRAHRAGGYLLMRRTPEILRLADDLLGSEVDDRVRVRAFGAAGPVLAVSGRADEALALSDELLPVALRLHADMPRAPMWVATTRIAALLLSGRLDDLRFFVDTVLGLPMGVGRGPETALRFARGRVSLFQGRVADARRDLLDAASTFRDSPQFERGLLGWSLALLAEAAALTGDADDAETFAGEALDVQGLDEAFYVGDAQRAACWARVARGDVSGAIQDLGDCASLLRERGHPAVEVWVLHDVLRLGGFDGAVERLEELAEVVDGRWARAAATLGRGLRDHDGERVEAAAEEMAEIGIRIHAASAFTQSAKIHDERGLQARAAAALRRSEDVRRTCDAVSTPTLAEARIPVALTRREREVATLAAQGLSNRGIADRLVVSIRTVEGHLYQAFTKLGVSSRDDLADALGHENQ